MKKFRFLTLALVLAIALGLLGACGSPDSSTPAASTPQSAAGDSPAAEPSGEGWTGEITFYAQAYTPADPSDANPNPPTMLKQYADEYAAANPGVTISFVELPADTVRAEWARAQAAAGQMPDISFELYNTIGSTYPTDMFTPLDKYFDMETPYVAGKTWGETFHPAVMKMTQVGSGEHYVVSADYVETGIYYNQRMFDEAGITTLPTTWEEFVEAGEKLKAAGFTPLAWSMAQDDTYAANWCNRVFLSNFYNDDMDKIDIDGTPGISDMENIIALKNGVVAVDDGRFIGWFDTLKNLTGIMNDGWSAKSDLEQKFMQEEVAMYWTGSWLPKKMVDAGVDFEYSSFPFPTPTSETLPGLSTDAVTSGAVGGPSGGFQYVVPSAQANSTMTDEKLAVVIDFLMYITEPGRVSEIVNEYGSFAPTMVGSTPADGMEGLLDNLNADYTIYNGGQWMTGVIEDAMFRTLHQYMMGTMTMEQCEAELNALYAEEMEIVIEDNPDWGIEAYLN